MGKLAVVFSCSHSNPEVGNERFSWLGDLIEDVKPDYVVDLGDGADMASLNSYDTRYPKAVVAQSYEADIDHYNEAQSRLWDRYSLKKKKRPYRIGLEGNHENRIKKAVALDPRIEGGKYGISFKHLQTDHWFEEYHEYKNSGPAIVDLDGVSYSHFFSAGNYGTAISGLHHAYALLQHRHHSSTCGHSHKRGLYFRDSAYPRPLIGLVAGNFKGKAEAWAGQSNNEWWSGVIIKREIDNGVYEPQFVSLETLRREYG
jgi:hypothetical protein